MSSTGLLYRTPADVRAIPNAQWEAWIRADHIPWDEFAPSRDVREVAYTIAKATIRRLDAARER